MAIPGICHECQTNLFVLALNTKKHNQKRREETVQRGGTSDVSCRFRMIDFPQVTAHKSRGPLSYPLVRFHALAMPIKKSNQTILQQRWSSLNHPLRNKASVAARRYYCQDLGQFMLIPDDSLSSRDCSSVEGACLSSQVNNNKPSCRFQTTVFNQRTSITIDKPPRTYLTFEDKQRDDIY